MYRVDWISAVFQISEEVFRVPQKQGMNVFLFSFYLQSSLNSVCSFMIQILKKYLEVLFAVLNCGRFIFM